jgi:hypothetical protein
MADIVTSLFGLTPIREQAELTSRARDLDLGTLIGQATVNRRGSPAQMQAYINQQGAQAALGGMAIRGLGSLFGLQDPQLQRATQLESILGETQMELGEMANDPTQFYPAIQQKLANAGFSREAMMAGQAGQKAMVDWTQSQANLALRQEQLEKAKQEKVEKRFVPVGKNIWDNEKQAWVTPPASAEDKTGDQSSDKRLTELIQIYNDEKLPADVRNKAADEANTLIPFVYKGTGSVPQLSYISQDGQDTGVSMNFGQGATPSDTVASITTPNATIKASPSVTYKPLPGSKAAQEFDEKQIKEIDGITTSIESLSNVKSSVDQALSLVSKETTGWNSFGKYLPGSPAMALDTQLKNIKSNASLETIKQLKQQSRTGATGFGALNLKELETIESSIAVINQANDEETIKKELTKIRDIFTQMQNRSKEIYKKVAGQEYIPQNRRVAFSFPPNIQLNQQQEAQVAKAIKAVEMGKVSREQAYEMLKQSPYFRGIDIQLGIGGY